ncbi:PREDICTED: ras-related protein Rab-17 isoform X2 [Crocodylus porosus]|uniref:ras-related protein Rab-17 isoform X2 n=1 Tax=Crocodylus porosus TaxID=8502 RepID=UPI00093B1C65|nr:PREDICTED: ras-related protein Rab-17 isoform X2 [Crocodylus porosus]
MAQRKMGKEMTVTSDGYHSKPTYVYKVVLLGSMAVGKSSLAFRYAKNSFRETMPTVGCSFFKQMIHLETANIMFEIWDTAGQEKYHSICHLYYRGARAALLVYDISRKETFNRAKLWLRELEKDFLHDEIVIILVGNKTDLATEREVTSEEGKEFARSKGLLHAETSAKSNHQVTDVFMAIGHCIILPYCSLASNFCLVTWIPQGRIWLKEVRGGKVAMRRVKFGELKVKISMPSGICMWS